VSWGSNRARKRLFGPNSSPLTLPVCILPKVSQLTLAFETASSLEPPSSTSPTTFIDNTRLPVHRWFRYSAGFSATWAASVIRQHQGSKLVLDPFAGSGTTLLAADECGIPSIGAEPHPFVLRVARTKFLWGSDAAIFVEWAAKLLERGRDIEPQIDVYPSVIRRSFTDESLAGLDQLRMAWLEVADETAASELAWLALASILRPVSHVGTAPWQYLLPAKRKRNPAEPFSAFRAQVRMMANDMLAFRPGHKTLARMMDADARSLIGIDDSSVDLVVTSPPYANNYDYADATRLEMTFFREIDGWSDLQGTVRERLIRSCSQHVSDGAVVLEAVLADSVLAPIRDDLAKACNTLAITRLTRGGRKNYHLMAAAYFLDMANAWLALRRACATGSSVCFVIGDSAPYGVHLPVIDWFIALATAAGFHGAVFEKTRDRNVKWRNRKHQVPLVEGHLWLEG